MTVNSAFKKYELGRVEIKDAGRAYEERDEEMNESQDLRKQINPNDFTPEEKDAAKKFYTEFKKQGIKESQQLGLSLTKIVFLEAMETGACIGALLYLQKLKEARGCGERFPA